MKRFVFILSLVILFAAPHIALADIAPPRNPPGSNLNPGSEVTQVRMLAETVLIDVQKDIVPGSLGRARVTADFTMQNLGNESERLAVRFPIATNNGYDNSYPEITNIAIRVNGNGVVFQRSDYPAGFGWSRDDVIPWAEFDVTFPAGKNVAIQVGYDLKGTGFPSQPFTSFYYTLETGAGWKDTIGSAEIILRLPYPASTQNVLLGYSDSPHAEGATFEDNEVRWHLENFEPGESGTAMDLEFDLVAPAVWQTVVTELDNVTKNPKDGEAWGRLGKAYKTAIITVKLFRTDSLYRSDPGGEELYQLSREAYEKCLALLPNDALWHAGFAELLAIHAYSNKNSAEADRAKEEIDTALQLAPNHPLVLKGAHNVQGILADGTIETGQGSDFPSPGPTEEPLPPLFNLAAIPGTYHINDVTYYNKNVQLTFRLRSGFSATMETTFEDGQKYTAGGTWKADFVNISLSLVDQFKEPLTFEFFVEEPPSHNLVITYSPSAYSFGNQTDPELINLAFPPTPTNTPAPTSTRRPTSTFAPSRTPSPTFSPLPTETPRPTLTTQPTRSNLAPTPVPKAPSSLCGSAVLIPLIAIIWLARKRTRS